VLPSVDRDVVATYLRPQRPRLALLAVVLSSSIVLQLANPVLLGRFIDRAQAGAPLERLLGIASAFLLVALLTQIATVAETYIAEDVGWRTTNAMRVDVTRHVLALDDSFHSEHGPGELIERIDGDVSAIAGFFARFVVHVVGSTLFLVGVLALLWHAEWRIGAVLTVTAVTALAFMTRGGGFVGRRARDARQANADLSAFLEERLGGLPDIKANGADGYTMRRFHERLRARFSTGRRSILATSVFSNTVNVVFVAGSATSLGLSVLLHRSGTLTVGAVFMVFRYTTMLRLPLERLSRHMNSFQLAMGGIVRVRELLRIEPRVVDGEGARLPAGALSVELDCVSFAYDAEPVLDTVSFRLEPGEVVGLLGRTGSGKTTLTRLLFRLHDVTAGAVRLGGVDVRRAQLRHLRRRVALVTQDVQLFAGTLRNNVTLYDPSVDDAELGRVFAALDLDRWLDDLPNGLDTVLGPRGRGLSAGEEQLVAFARVLLTDPGLVVLDEPSSRLDPGTEQLLEHAITRLLEGRTGIVIAHRLATVERADSVVVLDAGRLAEFGDRGVLAGDPSSSYSQLLRAQSVESLAVEGRAVEGWAVEGRAGEVLA
jgi:ABC-type multidrug transport system fused ATPase/permease subunit